MPYRDPNDQDENGTRVCKKCGERKDLITGFYLSSKPPSRRRTCRACAVVRAKELRTANPDKYRKAARKKHLRVEYGMTPEEDQAVLESQGYECAICDRDISTRHHIDHDHVTGKVRGALCFTCNTALGKFRDDKRVLQRAIDYLERSDVC